MTTATSQISLPVATLRELSSLRPSRFVALMVVDWALVLCAAGAATYWRTPLAVVLAIVVIGSRQHSFFILMHDATHFRGLRGKSANDRLANLLLAWPLGFTVERYRALHLAHHRWTNNEGDPDFARRVDNPEWRFPTKRSQLALLFLRDLLGISVLVEKWQWFCGLVRDVPHGGARRLVPTKQVLAWVAVLVVAALSGWVFPIVLWLVAMVTWTECIVRLRNISEHFGIPDENLLHPTRTVLTSRPVSWLLGLHNANYHVEHHLYPSVPLSRLPDLRRELMNDEVYRNRTHSTDGYLNVLRECMAAPRSDDRAWALAFFDRRSERW